MKEADVTIIGAGPAGLTAALFLAKKNISVTLIEKYAFPRDKVCGDCLGGYAISVLRQIDSDLFKRFTRFDNKVLGSGVHFFGPDRQKISVKAVTTVDQNIREFVLCKRIDFDNFLMDEVKKYHQIEIIQNTFISDISKHSTGLILYNSGSAFLNTKMAIMATGSIQSLVNKLNEKRSKKTHSAVGIRAYFEGVEDVNDTGYIELHFLKEILPGYLWIFPLPGNIVNVGLGLQSDIVAKRNLNLKKILLDYLDNSTYFKKRFKHSRQVSTLEGFPLALGGIKRRISGDHYVLTGDAANLIEPLFGEGIGHAMYSGKFAAEHVFKCLETGDFSAKFNKQYDKMVYKKLGATLKFSVLMQKIAAHPKLMSYLFKRVDKNAYLQHLLFSIINGQIPKTRWKGLGLISRMIFDFK